MYLWEFLCYKTFIKYSMNFNNLSNFEQNSLFKDEILWQSYANVEAQMAIAQSQVGIIPKKIAKKILQNSKLNKKDFVKIRQLRKKNKKIILSIVHVLDKKAGKAGGFLHWGGTTRNIIDTGNKLVIREIHRQILKELHLSIKILSNLCEKNLSTPMLARTMVKNALPISFGFKVAGWLESLIRVDKNFINSEKDYFTLFFGGAVGAMHGYKNKGYKFTNQFAKNLGLNNSLVPNRTSLETNISYLSSLSYLGLVIGKIANDIYMLTQDSINEIFESQSKFQVGSSTMPHKLNAVTIYQVMKISSLLRSKSSISYNDGLTLFEGDARSDFVIEHMLKENLTEALNLMKNFNNLLQKILINKKQMYENLIKEKEYIASENLMYSLGEKIGRQKSHELINKLVKKSHLKKTKLITEFLSNRILKKYFSSDQIEKVLNPLNYLGESIKISKATLKLSKNNNKKLLNRLKQKNLNIGI